MNNSNAAAKRRRAGIQPTTPPMPPQSQNKLAPTNTSMSNGQPGQPGQPGGYTLPQVIAIIDTRLTTLEKFMNETKESTDLSIPSQPFADVSTPSDQSEIGAGAGAVFMDSKEFADFVEDINTRFQLFADEINNMKEIVLKLQSFTMDVNKTLYENLLTNPDSEIQRDVVAVGDIGAVDSQTPEQMLDNSSEVKESKDANTTLSGKPKKR